METRVHLNPALLAPAEKWAVKGLDEFFCSRCAPSCFVFCSAVLTLGCRQHAFSAAAAADMKVIHILGSHDEMSLKIWSGMTS
jgi:hypothetical protein